MVYPKSLNNCCKRTTNTVLMIFNKVRAIVNNVYKFRGNLRAQMGSSSSTIKYFGKGKKEGSV